MYPNLHRPMRRKQESGFANRTYRSEAVYARFMQPDPIGYEAGLNLHTYVRNDPVNLIDPFGLRDVCVGLEGYRNCGPGPNIGVNIGAMPSTGGKPDPAAERLAKLECRAQPELCGEEAEQKRCAAIMNEPGPIIARGTTVTAVAALGLTITRGSFENAVFGSTGNFTTIGFGAGALGGVSETESTFRNIKSFVGFSDNVSVGSPIPYLARIPVIGKFLAKIGLGGTVHKNLNGENVGKSSDIGIGRNGVAATFTETIISNCSQ